MLVSRCFETEQSHWSSKFKTAFEKSTSPRMSSYDGSLSTQPDWQGHYSFLPPAESSIFGQPFEQTSNSGNDHDAASQQRSSGAQSSNLDTHGQASTGSISSPANHHRALDPLGLRQPKTEPATQDQQSTPGTAFTIKTETAPEETLTTTETTQLTIEPNPSGSVLSTGQNPSSNLPVGVNEESIPGKEEEDDEVVEDDDMIEGDGDGEGDGEDEAPNQPQTAAERTAARRKQKRFRLTHQQTRFLTTEFVKQPHPDAAHRERLSRQIPGLSPRQVQVWFQNRRAKIKRMNADDRHQLIKMRAVPDGFDNVQALHSPYGAVHALGGPITPPVDFEPSSYANHIGRPLLLETIRRDGDDHLSSTGLSPGFGSIGFTPSGTMSNPDILSPHSPSTNDRAYYSGHLTNTIGGPSRASIPYGRQNNIDTGASLHSPSRQHIRPIQPLSLRETMSRPRSDTLHSPLRAHMVWKGDSIDYTAYSSSSNSPGGTGRHTSVYQSDPIGSSAGGTLGYDTGSYTTSGLQPSTNINYSSLQQPSQTRSRLRAASASLPLGLDLRHQYRSFSSGHSLQSPSHSSTPRAANTTPYGTSSSYSMSFPSAPLTAPIDFSLSRTPSIRSSIQDYSIPHMSAPIAPPHDFTQALHGNIAGSSSRTPMRDTFNGGPLAISQIQGPNDKVDEHSQDGLGGSGTGLKRKRSSFSLSQVPQTSSSSQNSPPYGHTN
ncbi:putative homeobox domain-containing protein [Rosellinia necatrix]|uniref:Putative homeobox domain-containing protein n=1 Tax=Rosellinia necatrix TaxID=77044 RepID=A0A1S7ULA8_ROSNE|nr:putative homeobox domain-containing protein [Rosellinia necatrix]